MLNGELVDPALAQRLAALERAREAPRKKRRPICPGPECIFDGNATISRVADAKGRAREAAKRACSAEDPECK